MREVSATEFKATCLALLDEVARTGEPLLILKRGRPVAQLVPPTAAGTRHPQQALRGSVTIVGDVISPPLPTTAWRALGGRRRR